MIWMHQSLCLQIFKFHTILFGICISASAFHEISAPESFTLSTTINSQCSVQGFPNYSNFNLQNITSFNLQKLFEFSDTEKAEMNFLQILVQAYIPNAPLGIFLLKLIVGEKGTGIRKKEISEYVLQPEQSRSFCRPPHPLC